jgi:hypothetical protein
VSLNIHPHMNGNFLFRRRTSAAGQPNFSFVAYFQARGITAEVNDAPEDDYRGRAAYDVLIGDEPFEVKTDWIAATSKIIFVELAAVEHSHAAKFPCFIPNPYGFDIRIFPRQQLLDYYRATLPVRRADGSFYQVYKYPHGAAGDQRDNRGVFVPMEVVKAEGMAPWQVARRLSAQAA